MPESTDLLTDVFAVQAMASTVVENLKKLEVEYSQNPLENAAKLSTINHILIVLGLQSELIRYYAEFQASMTEQLEQLIEKHPVT